MRLSIIVPSYNTEKYLQRCLDSLTRMDEKDIEILLVDDGSSDNTGKICDEYAERFPFVKVFHQENSGVSAARNKGIKLATGKYVCFVDSDDFVNESGIKEILDSLDKNESVPMAVHGFCKISDQEEKKYYYPYKGNETYKIVTGKELIYSVFNGPGYAVAKIYKRELLDGIWFDEKLQYSEDTKFVLEVMKKCDEALLCKQAIYCYYYDREGNVTGEGLGEKYLAYLNTNRCVYDTYGNRYPTVGMSRCFTAATTVLSKIPLGRGYAKYYCAVRRTIRFRLNELIEFWKDDFLRESKKQKLKCIGMILFPHICVVFCRIKYK